MDHILIVEELAADIYIEVNRTIDRVGKIIAGTLIGVYGPVNTTLTAFQDASNVDCAIEQLQSYPQLRASRGTDFIYSVDRWSDFYYIVEARLLGRGDIAARYYQYTHMVSSYERFVSSGMLSECVNRANRDNQRQQITVIGADQKTTNLVITYHPDTGVVT